jgi:hypothetical protein
VNWARSHLLILLPPPKRNTFTEEVGEQTKRHIRESDGENKVKRKYTDWQYLENVKKPIHMLRICENKVQK